MAAGLRGDQIIILANRRAGCFEFGADIAGMRGVFRFEREDIDAQAEKFFQQEFVAIAPLAFGEPIAHFEQGDDRQRDRGARSHLFSEPETKR